MARQLGERIGVSECFADPRRNVESDKSRCRSHYHSAAKPLPTRQTMSRAGSHVYLEKPFTVTAKEANELIELAENNNLKITAGHNYQFTLEMLEMRRLVKEGFLGGSRCIWKVIGPTTLGIPVMWRQSSETATIGCASCRAAISQHHQPWDRQVGGVSRRRLAELTATAHQSDSSEASAARKCWMN